MSTDGLVSKVVANYGNWIILFAEGDRLPYFICDEEGNEFISFEKFSEAMRYCENNHGKAGK